MTHSDDIPHEEHEEHVNHEAWVIPYADLLTLLMAMFIALFAMSNVDMAKFKALALGLNHAFSGHDLNTGVFADPTGSGLKPGVGDGESSVNGGSTGPGSSPKGETIIETLTRNHANAQAAASAERKTLSGVQQQIDQAAKELGIAQDVSFQMQERGLVVRLVSDDVLFASGSAALEPGGQELLRRIAAALNSIDNPLLIEGHTDNQPIATAQFPSNWELSTNRAGSVLRFLAANAVDVHRMRPTGWADLHPIASNDTEEGRGRNRRVEIVIESKQVEAALTAAGVTDKPVATPSLPSGPTAGVGTADPHLGNVVGNLAG